MPALLALSLWMVFASPVFAVTETVWNGGEGDWFGAPGWSNGVPDGDFDASIDGGKSAASRVTLARDVTVVNLTVDAGDNLRVAGGHQVTVGGRLTAPGRLQVDAFNTPPTTFRVGADAEIGSLGLLFSTAHLGGNLRLLGGGVSLTGSTVTVAGNVTATDYLQLFESTMRVAGNFTVQNPSGVENGNGVRLWDRVDALTVGGTFVNGATAFLTNPGRAPVSVGSFLNAGDVVTWSRLDVTAGRYVQTAGTTTLFAPDPGGERGALVVPNGRVEIDGGTLTGLGLVDADLTLGGTLAVDRTSVSDAHFDVNGRYTQLVDGVLEISINDTHRFDELYGDLRVGGEAQLGGTVHFVFCATCPPRTGTRFTFLSYGALVAGSRFTSVEFEGWTPPEWALDYGAEGVTLTITRGVIASPEPGIALLLCLGLVIVASVRTKAHGRQRKVTGRSSPTESTSA